MFFALGAWMPQGYLSYSVMWHHYCLHDLDARSLRASINVSAKRNENAKRDQKPFVLFRLPRFVSSRPSPSPSRSGERNETRLFRSVTFRIVLVRDEETGPTGRSHKGIKALVPQSLNEARGTQNVVASPVTRLRDFLASLVVSLWDWRDRKRDGQSRAVQPVWFFESRTGLPRTGLKVSRK